MSKSFEEVKKEYENLRIEITSNESRIKELLQNEAVREYEELIKRNRKSVEDFEKLSLDLQEQQMMNCKHIFVIGSIEKEWDGHRTDKYETHYCIKCGLDTRYADFSYQSILSPLQRKMGNIYNKTKRNGVSLEFECHPLLAQKIYEGIKKANPSILDEDVIKYFKAAFYSIEHKNEEKHLGLRK